MDEKSQGKRITVDDIKGKVEFRNVWFRYPTRPDEFVLRGLNLEIEAGESVALVGESGCGKSTFINLLMRFYDPEYGQVLLDDVDKVDDHECLHGVLPVLRRRHPKMLIVITCNEPTSLGPSFLRPGRGGELLAFGPPSRDERCELLVHYMERAGVSSM